MENNLDRLQDKIIQEYMAAANADGMCYTPEGVEEFIREQVTDTRLGTGLSEEAALLSVLQRLQEKIAVNRADVIQTISAAKSPGLEPKAD